MNQKRKKKQNTKIQKLHISQFEQETKKNVQMKVEFGNN